MGSEELVKSVGPLVPDPPNVGIEETLLVEGIERGMMEASICLEEPRSFGPRDLRRVTTDFTDTQKSHLMISNLIHKETSK